MRAEEQRDYWKKAKDATFIHCPFCGARQDADRAHWWGVRCGNCGATGPSYPPRREKGYSQEAEDAFDPIAAWNKRAGEAELAALRKLREACQRYVFQDGELYGCPVYVLREPLNDSEGFAGELPDIVAQYGAQDIGEALAACDEASAPTGDEHK